MRFTKKHSLALLDPCWPEEIPARGCFDLGGKSGGGGGGQTVTQNVSEPWAEQKPALSFGYDQAKQNYQSATPSYFPNSTVVGFSPQTETALQAQENRAMAGSPLNMGAQTEAMKTLGGDYLNQGNPAFAAMADRAVRPLTETYQNTVMPGIDARFAMGGRSGSNIARANALNTASNNYMRQVGDVGASLAYPSYEAERGRMATTMAQAPALAATDYTDIGQLGQVGGMREQQAGLQLQDQINRFNFEQNRPDETLRRYMSLVSGGQGGTSTTTAPLVGANPWLQGLGAAGTMAGIAGSLFGNGGVFR